MSGRQKRRREKALLRDPFADKAFWEAWHNPPCPEVEEVKVEAVTHCRVLERDNSFSAAIETFW